VSDDSKKYSEREVSLILSKAVELTGSSNPVGGVEDGLTLEEIASIAAEAGVDPNSIARAARLVRDEVPPSALRRIMGGDLHLRRRFDLPGELTAARAQRIVSLARSQTQTHGAGGADSTGVSWSTRSAGHVFVSAHGEAAETRVQITVDNRAAFLGTLFLGTLGAMATLYAAVAAGDSGFVNPYLILAGGGGITAAWVWSAMRRITRKTRATLEGLIDAIGESVDR
jgi:hypothetical protein